MDYGCIRWRTSTSQFRSCPFSTNTVRRLSNKTAGLKNIFTLTLRCCCLCFQLWWAVIRGPDKVVELVVMFHIVAENFPLCDL